MDQSGRVLNSSLRSADAGVYRGASAAIASWGADRVAFGSDYPFPLGEARVGALVRGASSLSDDEKRRSLDYNPRRFLGLASL